MSRIQSFGNLVPTVTQPTPPAQDQSDILTLQSAKTAVAGILNSANQIANSQNLSKAFKDDASIARTVLQTEQARTETQKQNLQNKEAQLELDKLREMELFGAQRELAKMTAEGKPVSEQLAFFSPDKFGDPENHRSISRVIAKTLASSVNSQVNQALMLYVGETGGTEGFTPSDVLAQILQDIPVDQLDDESQIDFYAEVRMQATNSLRSIERSEFSRYRNRLVGDSEQAMHRSVDNALFDPDAGAKEVNEAFKDFSLMANISDQFASDVKSSVINSRAQEAAKNATSIGELKIIREQLVSLADGMDEETRKQILGPTGSLKTVDGFISNSVMSLTSHRSTAIEGNMNDALTDIDLDIIKNNNMLAFVSPTDGRGLVPGYDDAFEQAYGVKYSSLPESAQAAIKGQADSMARTENARRGKIKGRTSDLETLEQVLAGNPAFFPEATRVMSDNVRKDALVAYIQQNRVPITDGVLAFISKGIPVPENGYAAVSDMFQDKGRIADGRDFLASSRSVSGDVSTWNFISNIKDQTGRDLAEFMYGHMALGEDATNQAMLYVANNPNATVSGRMTRAREYWVETGGFAAAGFSSHGFNAKHNANPFLSNVAQAAMAMEFTKTQISHEMSDKASIERINEQAAKNVGLALRNLSLTIEFDPLDAITNHHVNVNSGIYGVGSDSNPQPSGIRSLKEAFRFRLQEARQDSRIGFGEATYIGTDFVFKEHPDDDVSYTPFISELGTKAYMKWDAHTHKSSVIWADSSQMKKIIRNAIRGGFTQDPANITVRSIYSNRMNHTSAFAASRDQGIDPILFAIGRVQSEWTGFIGFIPTVDDPEYPDYAARIESEIRSLGYPSSYTNGTTFFEMTTRTRSQKQRSEQFNVEAQKFEESRQRTQEAATRAGASR